MPQIKKNMTKKINVKVCAGSKRSEILKIDNDNYKAWLLVAPEKGKANKELREVLSKYFNTSISKINITKGLNSKYKVVKIS